MTPNFFRKRLAEKIKPPHENDCWRDSESRDMITWFAFIIVWVFVIGRTWYGIAYANDPKHCHVKSIGDVLVSPFYAIGCNIGKDRFDESLIIGE